MKEVRTIKTVEVEEVKFFANDGNEFETETECANYERRQNIDKVNKEFEKLRPKRLNVPLVDWVGCENEVISVTVNDSFEYDVTVKNYFAIQSHWMDFNGFTEKRPTEFPADLIIVSGCEWVDIFGTKEDLKTQLLKVVAELD